MLRLIIAFIIMIHGLIHFMGFAKAFQYGNITQLTKEISKPVGTLWLLTALLFLISAILLLVQKNSWWMICVPALAFSQILIFMYWTDAKFGSVANLIILIYVIIITSNHNFEKMYRTELKELNNNSSNTLATQIQLQEYKELPAIIIKWLQNSNVLNHTRIQTVYLTQTGEMKTSPGSKWIPFKAEQYFTIEKPAFLWKTTIHPNPFFSMTGRDKFENGEGYMLIKLFSLVPVVNAKGKEINQGTLVRYLAEMCWFPSAALNNYIKWVPLDPLSAKATMNYLGTEASGIFYFNSNADLVKFEADRYYTANKKSAIEKWQVTCKDYKSFNGIRIPFKNEVTWKLKEGDFTWLKLELTDIVYNQKIM